MNSSHQIVNQPPDDADITLRDEALEHIKLTAEIFLDTYDPDPNDDNLEEQLLADFALFIQGATNTPPTLP